MICYGVVAQCEASLLEATGASKARAQGLWFKDLGHLGLVVLVARACRGRQTVSIEDASVTGGTCR